MALFVNCGWLPAAGAEIQARIGQIARLLERQETVALVGRDWYRLGGSKKEALSKPLSIKKVEEVRSWDRGRILADETGPEEIDYSLGAWNGRDPPDVASLSIMLHEPPTWMDTLVFSGLGLESLKDKWRDVLAWTEAVAHHLGGLSVVSSDELREWAEAQGIEQADRVAYAAFDGREGRSSVSAATWTEAISRDKKRLEEFIRTYRAMVGE